MIKDSGERTKFQSGAVRDMSEGKGRFDLMPLHEMGQLFCRENNNLTAILDNLNIMKGYAENLDKGLDVGSMYIEESIVHAILFFIADIKGIEPKEVNCADIAEVMLSVSIHFEEGAKKYGEHNWEKGIPLSSFVDSATRHLMKVVAGHKDERHDRAFLWNMLAYYWTMMNI